jgi:hypothetical protein
MGFSDVLRRGKRIFGVKDKGGKWGRCEECDERALLYPYDDKEGQVWMLCEYCLEILAKDDE